MTPCAETLVLRHVERGCPRVGFILLSPPTDPIPSTRIAALNAFPGLVDAGFEPVVLHAPHQPEETPALPDLCAQRIADAGCALVVFQKVRGPRAVALAEELEQLGVRTVYLVCDLVDELMCRATSATVVVTDFLRSLHPAALRHKVHVVHDGIERPQVVAVPRAHDADARDPLRAVLVTSSELLDIPVLGLPPPWLQVTVVGGYAPAHDAAARRRRWCWALRREPQWTARWRQLRALACPRIRRVAWTPDGVYDELQRADVGIIPVDTASGFRLAHQPVPSWQIKSENRLTLKMAAGLPVVATPIPAYETVVNPGVDGFLARTRADWLTALGALRRAELRSQVAAAARARVLDAFSVSRQSARLAAVLDAVLGRTGEAGP
jgi:Glycosyl transferases group 1